MRTTVVALGIAALARTATAQTPPPSADQGGMAMAMPTNPLDIDHVRDGSGTSWLPDMSPMQGLMRARGPWTLMLHGGAFLQLTASSGARGDSRVGSVNALMGMAQRSAVGGQLLLRAMLSLEPLTVGKCGYPDLLQSGELCNGASLHDRQHPHDLFMEVAADYRRAIDRSLAVEVYGGPAGEPALGPTGFPHRPSAMPDPVAPITHHWLDSTHISFGVVTAALYGRTWKIEGSAFNGREPDDKRYGFDLAALDSYSGRVWLLPGAQWAIQVSAGHLQAAELMIDGSREDVDRITASATYHRLVNARVWATTIAWGRNREGDQASSAVLAETAADLTARDTVFARGEVVGKTTTDLAVPSSADAVFVVAKVAVGYTRWIAEGHGLRAGLGGSAGVARVPGTLAALYGGRHAREFAVFFNARIR